MNRPQAAEQGEWHRPQKQSTMDEADPKAVYKKLLYAAVSTNLKPNHSSNRQNVNHTSQFQEAENRLLLATQSTIRRNRPKHHKHNSMLKQTKT